MAYVVELSPAERIFNVAAALSVFAWAAMGLREACRWDGSPTVRICIALLHLCVGLLFLFRTPLKAAADGKQISLVLISFLGGAVPFALAPPAQTWPVHAQASFAVGILLAVLSLTYLGRSFAILPAIRNTVVRGPYRIVRHPAYAGEMIAVASCFSAHVCWASALALVGGAAALILRIMIEESLLNQTAGYRSYTAQVRYRLLPGLW